MIHFELQTLLKKLFGVEVPIVMTTTKTASNATQIVFVEHQGLSDPWSGGTFSYDVFLENFTRPDNGKPLVFWLEYAIHDLSGQIDAWDGEANNIEENEYDAFYSLLDINNAGLYPNNHLSIQVSINNKKIKLLRGDS